jgi:N-acetylneuraminic acid mutarotase
MRALALVFGFAFAGAGFSATPDADGSWSSAPDMREARAAHAVVSNGKTIYALAGTGPEGPVLEVERFDGRKWKLETRLPGNGLNAPAAAVIEDKIYLVGGFNTTTNVPSGDVLVYDVKKKTWSNAAELPAPRGGHSAAVLDGKIHVVGGGNSKSTIADHSVYDPATNQWRDLAPLPRSEGSPALVVFHGNLYAIGGRSGPSDFGDVYIYDAATDRWTNGPAIFPRGTAGAAEYCGTLYLFGGESQLTRSSLSEVFRLDEAQGKWIGAKPMLHARNFARAVLFKDSVYVVGGSLTPGSSHASAGSKIVESFNATCSAHN